MREVITFVVLAACGRVGFDSPADAPTDARTDALISCTAVSLNDEDGDSLLDDCDPCPHVSGDASDADGDGVGDACDPRVTPTESIALFDPFLAPSAAWDYKASRVEGGTLVMQGSQVILVELVGSPQRSVYSVRADLRATGSAQHQFSIQMRDVDPERFFCELYADPPDLYVSSTYTLDGSQFVTSQTSIAGSFVDSDVVLEMVLDPPQFTCRLQWLGTVNTAPSTTIPTVIDPSIVRIVMNGVEGGLRHFTRIAMD